MLNLNMKISKCLINTAITCMISHACYSTISYNKNDCFGDSSFGFYFVYNLKVIYS